MTKTPDSARQLSQALDDLGESAVKTAKAVNALATEITEDAAKRIRRAKPRKWDKLTEELRTFAKGKRR